MKKLIATFFIFIPLILSAQSLDRVEMLLHHPFSDFANTKLDCADARIALQKKATGLRFQSAATNNDYAGLELGNVWRISGGVTYDFLDGGLFDSKNRVKALENEKRILEIKSEHEFLDKNYSYIFNYFIYAFNQEKKLLLNQKKFLLSSLLNKNYSLYYNHELNYEEILYLQSFDQEADIMLSSMDHMDKLFESLVDVEKVPSIQVHQLPILELNIDSLLNNDPMQYIEDIKQLEKKDLVLKQKQRDQQKLGIYFNLHYRPNIVGVNRTGFYKNFGVRYTTPLRFDNEEERKLVALEQENLDEIYNDLLFNNKKELINLVLEHNTKIRQYSNFYFKLKKLQEKKRVESAIQNVSTINTESRRNWKIDLEILNVQYELLELKEFIYLSILRIYNKAKLEKLSPYVIEKTFDESQNRFRGKRVLRIAGNDVDKLKKEFILSYLEKNDFTQALWVGSQEAPLDMQYKLYNHGIQMVANQDVYLKQGIIVVPVKQFENRGDMELWIAERLKEHKNGYLFFEGIDDLIKLDSKTIGE